MPCPGVFAATTQDKPARLAYFTCPRSIDAAESRRSYLEAAGA